MDFSDITSVVYATLLIKWTAFILQWGGFFRFRFLLRQDIGVRQTGVALICFNIFLFQLNFVTNAAGLHAHIRHQTGLRLFVVLIKGEPGINVSEVCWVWYTFRRHPTGLTQTWIWVIQDLGYS